MAFAKGKGLQVNVWTVDDPTEMRRLIALGVDSIITNVPAQMRDVLAAQKK
jgi:glycerophosphoryl diester phosphodiesterase